MNLNSLPRFFIPVLVALLLAPGCSRPPAPSPQKSSAPIIIGDINHYTGLAKFANGSRKGWELAVEEINAGGGVLGRPLRVISRDDGGRPETSVRVAEELVKRDNAQFLIGTLFDHCGLAVAEWAKQNKVLFLKPGGGTDTHIGKGNRYSFRSGPTDYVLSGMLADEAAKLPAKRWAVVAPNFEYGHSMTRAFRQQLQKRRPDVEWIAEQFPTTGKIDAGAVVQALKAAKPDALLCVLFQNDLVKFHREGLKRGLLGTLPVVGPTIGIPEELEVLAAETPEGWITYGLPFAEANLPAARQFAAAVQARYQEAPGMCLHTSYILVKLLAAAIEKAGTTDTERVVDAIENLTINAPTGRLTMLASTHETDLGLWIGKTAVREGKGVLVDYAFKPSAPFLPSAEQIRQWRTAR